MSTAPHDDPRPTDPGTDDGEVTRADEVAAVETTVLETPAPGTSDDQTQVLDTTDDRTQVLEATDDRTQVLEATDGRTQALEAADGGTQVPGPAVTPGPDLTKRPSSTPSPEPAAAPAAATADDEARPPRSTPRVGTVVWGLVLAVLGLGVLAWAGGYRIDVGLATILLVAGAGVALLVGSIVSGARSRRTQQRS
ncbi:hypothetical protein [Cellulomonas gilvus]|uniref:Uncharacterized protein n=1 Tax=Cellulomonas gilvus (strain ATCC 13127 / NRRL B-14078) TaxID=593907 RepID=F8A010_CELGA|nr:hypothetical protein [Cellulomonas gilvus]AEI11429.1 hypothetical protein Celgi_0910 [Cellulomonas gilvus ATCC 13127]